MSAFGRKHILAVRSSRDYYTLPKSAYEACIEYELGRHSLRVRKRVSIPFHYDDLTLDIGYRLDLLVEDAVVVELKSVHTTGVPVFRLWRGSLAPLERQTR